MCRNVFWRAYFDTETIASPSKKQLMKLDFPSWWFLVGVLLNHTNLLYVYYKIDRKDNETVLINSLCWRPILFDINLCVNWLLNQEINKLRTVNDFPEGVFIASEWSILDIFYLERPNRRFKDTLRFFQGFFSWDIIDSPQCSVSRLF